VIGAYNTPERVSSKIVSAVSLGTKWLSSKGKPLGWIPVPDESFSVEPVWYLAFNPESEDIDRENSSATESNPNNNPIVIVAMKSGRIYVGEIRSIPIVRDTEPAKDFLIQRASFYADGDIYKEDRELHFLDNDIDAVLLNTANVESIRLYYDRP